MKRIEKRKKKEKESKTNRNEEGNEEEGDVPVQVATKGDDRIGGLFKTDIAFKAGLVVSFWC